MKSFPILASISLFLVPGGIGLNLPMPVMAQVAQKIAPLSNGLGADAILNDSYMLNMDRSQPSAAQREEMRQLSWAVQVALGSKEIEDYDEAIRLNPDDADAYYNLGLAYRQQENNRQALESFRQAAELYQQQGKQEDYQDALERIRELQ